MGPVVQTLTLSILPTWCTRDERGHQPQRAADDERCPATWDPGEVRDQDDRGRDGEDDEQLDPAGQGRDVPRGTQRPTDACPTVNASCHPSPDSR
jgi:hypothetical protein